LKTTGYHLVDGNVRLLSNYKTIIQQLDYRGCMPYKLHKHTQMTF